MWPLITCEVHYPGLRSLKVKSEKTIRKRPWLPKMLYSNAMYCKQSKLHVPTLSAVEDYKVAKVRLSLNRQELDNGRRWSVTKMRNCADKMAKHHKLIAAVCEGWCGLGEISREHFFGRRLKAVREVSLCGEVRRLEDEERKVEAFFFSYSKLY